MPELSRALILALLVFSLAGLPGSAQAAKEETLGFSRVAINFIDVLVVRPVTLVTTAVGSVLYGITYPITVWREDDAALDMLVKAPFDATFRRCLGCPAGEE